MNARVENALRASDVNVGDELTPMDIDVTTTAIVTGAIASQDYMPMHHDRDFAQSQGAPDIFFNIMSTNAYLARFVTDWAGPEVMLKKISVRLGVQVVPGQVLKFRGEVLSKTEEGDECVFEASVTASNEAGDHASGTLAFSLPT